jgi:hypothetical protein
MADQQRRQSRRVQDLTVRQEERARQREEEQARARTQGIRQARARPPAEQEQVLETEVRRLVNRIYHRDDLQHQVERMSDGHLGFLRVLDATQKIAELKRADPPRSKIEEISGIVRVILQIKKTALEGRQATNTYDNYRYGFNGHRRPVLGRSTGQERLRLEQDQQEYDRIMDAAATASAAAAQELENLNVRFNEMINFEAPEGVYYPDTDEDEDEDEEEMVDLEVHQAAAKVGSEGQENLLKVLDNKKPESAYPTPISQYVKEKFENFITNYTGYNAESKSEKITKLNKVLTKLQSAPGTVNNPKNRKLIGHIVDFVIEQPDEFKDSYVSSYIHDCANAYPERHGDERLSCIGGIIERFYLVLAQYISTICPGPKEKPCPRIYRRLHKVLNKIAYEDNNELKNEFIKEWASINMSDDEHGKTGQQLRESFVQFMEDKYKELYGEEELEAPTKKMIQELANENKDTFERGYFGGKKTRRKYTAKKSKRRKNRKTNRRYTGKK